MEILLGKKFPVIVLSALLAAALFFSPAVSRAATSADTQARIIALQQQLAQLQAQLAALLGASAGTIPSACVGINFSRDLMIGMTGNDVRCLQTFLNQAADTRVALSGAGSAGNETSYFGTLTYNAVVKFQNKYASEILYPHGLVAGNGFVGLPTRTKLNALLTPTTTTGTTGGTTTTGTTTTGGIVINGQEGMVTVSANPTPANGVKAYEGNNKVSVMGIRVRATGSDLSVQRLSLEFNARAYDYLERIYLYDGNTLIASSDLDSSTLSRISTSVYRITLSDFAKSVVVPQDTTKVLTVKVDVSSAISNSLLASGSSFNLKLSVAANGVRALDQASISEYAPAANNVVVRTININNSQTANAAMVIGRASNSPATTSITSDSQGNIEGKTLLIFSARAQRDDLMITEIDNVEFATGTGYLVPNTAYLYDDAGDVLDSATPDRDTGIVNFTNLDTVVKQDKTRIYTIKFDDQISTSGADDGKKYKVAVAALNSDSEANLVVERSDGEVVPVENLAGSAVSNNMFVYRMGSMFTLNSVTTTSTTKTDHTQSTISATFNIGITALGGDIYIPKTNAFKVFYSLNDILPGAPVTSISYFKPAAAMAFANSYRVSQDTTVNFIVHATYVLDGPVGSYNLRVAEIDWGTNDAAPAANKSTYMSEDYISESKYLQ